MHPPLSSRMNTNNPLNWLRLLWWVLIDPVRYGEYCDRYGEDSLREIGVLLTSSLAWLTVLIVVLIDLPQILPGILPALMPPLRVVAWVLIVGLCWLITIYVNGTMTDGSNFAVASGVAVAVTLLAMISMALLSLQSVSEGLAPPPKIGLPTGVVAVVLSVSIGGSVAFGITVFCLGMIVRFAAPLVLQNIEERRASWRGKLLLALLLLGYGVLILLRIGG